MSPLENKYYKAIGIHPLYMRLIAAQVEQLSQEFENKTAQEILGWALSTFGPKIGFASSFGAEDVAVIDMMARIDRNARVFTLDTGRLNQETYDVIDDIRARYGIKIDVFFPDQEEVEEMVKNLGMNLMYASVENRKLCCEIRKVRPLNRALADLDGWITGLRRNQASTRADTKKIEIDSLHDGMIKLNPIADWTSDMVWDYVRTNNVPYNKLHDMGYPSIGCEPCTRAIKTGEDPRAGRWWWESAANKECGLHFDPTKKK
jgi:phosphoadenosine phosphosulfate reductase